MKVYLYQECYWVALHSAASGDLKARFTTEQDAIDYAARQGWVVVNRPLPMTGQDYHTFGEA